MTDVLLDLTALSTGLGFSGTKYLLEECEGVEARAFHLMMNSNTGLDDLVSSKPSNRLSPVTGHGFDVGMSALEATRIWIPQVHSEESVKLPHIGEMCEGKCKIIPILPLSAQSPQLSSNLRGRLQNELVRGWEIDPRDVIYASDKNPLDSFRKLSSLKDRLSNALNGSGNLQIVLLPLGSNVITAGAMMAAIEFGFPVQYAEGNYYEAAGNRLLPAESGTVLVHSILSGPLYGKCGSAFAT